MDFCGCIFTRLFVGKIRIGSRLTAVFRGQGGVSALRTSNNWTVMSLPFSRKIPRGA